MAQEYENSTSELASARGHELAPQLDENGDEFMLVEAFDEDKDGDVMARGARHRTRAPLLYSRLFFII